MGVRVTTIRVDVFMEKELPHAPAPTARSKRGVRMVAQ